MNSFFSAIRKYLVDMEIVIFQTLGIPIVLYQMKKLNKIEKESNESHPGSQTTT